MALDWLTKAAREIAASPHDLDEDEVRAVIVTHVPFQLDVAYMPVPRCDQCKHWKDAEDTNDNIGTCTREWRPDALMWVAGGDTDFRTMANFGCVQWEPR